MKSVSQYVIALIFLLSQTVFASSEPLVIAVDMSFSPFTYKDENGSAAGLHVEITKGALDHAGINYEFRLLPWKRIIEISDAGGIDLSMPWRHKPDRFVKYHMIGPFTDQGSGTYFWARKDSTITWSTLADLKGASIAAISGFAYPKTFENADYLTKSLQTGDTKMLVKLIHAKRYELVLSDETVFMAAAKYLKLEKDIKRIGPSLESVRRYAVVPKQKPDIAKKVSKAFIQFRKTPHYRQILKKYVN